MYSLNLSYFNFTAIKNSACLLICLSLFACSSINKVDNNYFNDDGYARGFISENYANYPFIPMNKNTIKKSLPSDYHLMMSLLNRPITADQTMMLAFTQEKASYSYPYSYSGVQIKGDKSSDEPNSRAKHAYAQLISQDINAVRIIAPQ